MKKKKLLACLLAVSLLPMPVQAAGGASAAEENQLYIPVEKPLAKSELGNPFLGFDQNGGVLYGGDPAVLVDGDTVYCYVGHDTADGEFYQMPDYRVYSSKDLVHWKYENMIMNMTQVNWSVDNTTAWASQVGHYHDKYYQFFCTTANIAGQNREHCIGVSGAPLRPGPSSPCSSRWY